MKYWPVPNSYSKIIPRDGSPGSYWEKRSERYHCGVDIYAPEGSDVLSIEDGKVIDIRVFTSPEKTLYWNTTYSILIRNKTSFICKYAELGDVIVTVNESVKAGQLIGYVGVVLNLDKITDTSPKYIQELKKRKKPSMLHFELYKSIPDITEMYEGGNWFGDTQPKKLLDPSEYLHSSLYVAVH